MTQQYQPPPFGSQQPYPQQYPQPYQPGAYGPQPSSPPPTNGVATGGFVVALIGAVLALVPFLGVVAWVISPVGLVLSIVGLTVAGRRGGTGRGLSVAGVVLGVVGLLICFLWAIGFAAATSGANTPSSAPSYPAPSYPAPTYSAPTQSAADSSATAPAGSFGQGTYTVGSEIAPGRYRTAGAPEDSLFPLCMATRQRTDGTLIGMPETTNNGPAYITVRAGDGQVEFSGDCTWSPAS